VVVYSTVWCGYCVRAKALLESRGIPYQEVLIDEDEQGRLDFRSRLAELTGGRTVPQVVVDGEVWGGYDMLVVRERSGELKDLAIRLDAERRAA
jgi:glutaredoxin 3